MDVPSVPTVEGSMPEDGCKNHPHGHYKLSTINFPLYISLEIVGYGM